MKKVYIFNNDTLQLEPYVLDGSSFIPYSSSTLTPNEFAPNSSIFWTTSDTMKAYAKSKQLDPSLVIVRAFDDPASHPLAIMNPSRAGGIGFHLSSDTNDIPTLYRLLAKNEYWNHMADIEHTKDFIHADQDYTFDSSEYTRYPTLRLHDASTYVFVLQTILNYLGYPIMVNGVFDTATQNAVNAFKTANNLQPNGIMDSDGWIILMYVVQEKENNS